jgi:uncharacterized protein
MKIAIIGSGISGLYAAWKLSKVHEVTVFEKNNYFGGHTDTHQLNIDGEQVAVDSGFIVFNEHNYPLFCAMLKELGIQSQSSDMGFSVNNQVTGLQYNPSKKFSLLFRPQNVHCPVQFQSLHHWHYGIHEAHLSCGKSYSIGPEWHEHNELIHP